ncbi:MAG: N-acetyl-gamma-glutamyl-phosphate reductase [Proteobacteria bacterium]|nr:N-acetyl-gamma-glutamyl-phosphate reductase [Pseudomonadota bacterium]
MSERHLHAVVVGATGYTGSELVRLLADHPHVTISAFVSSTSVGENVADKIPYWRGQPQMFFHALDDLPQLAGDVVFFATPHAVAMQQAGALLAAGKVVIDLGSDFRLQDVDVFRQWYGEHTATDLLPQVVYGLTEYNRQQIKSAQLIACPGCYATAIELALLPFIAGGHIQGDIIADAKSGTSGAGKQSNRPDLLFAEMANNYKAYALAGHRHHPEIIQTLASSGKTVPTLTFVPHLLPLARGLFANIYFNSAQPENATALLAEYWANHPFIEVVPPPLTAELGQVVGTNRIILSAHPIGEQRVLICSALDNLLKGAAGQAVQNMNIRFDLPETAGLVGGLSNALGGEQPA